MKRFIRAFQCLSIRRKLILSYSLLVAAPVLMSLVFSYNILSNILTEKLSNVYMGSISSSSRRVDRLLDDMKFTLLDISTNKVLKETLQGDINRQKDNSSSEEPVNKLIKNNTVNQIIERAPLTILMYNSYITILSNTREDYGNWEGYVQYSSKMKQSNWYKELTGSKSSRRLMWIGLNKEQSGYWTKGFKLLEAAILIEGNQSDKQGLGVLHIGIPEKYINDVIKSEDNNVSTFLVDQNGVILSSQDKNTLGSSIGQKINLDVLINKEEDGLYIDKHNGKRWIVAYSTIEKAGWKVVATIPYDTMLTPIVNTRNSLISFNLIFILSFIGIALFISRSISKPIMKLRKKMNQVANGDLNQRVEILYNDEIGDLSYKFNSMLDQICSLMEITKIQERKKREAELEMLQAQINPHFLFNTLSSIRWAAATQKAEKVEKMVLALTNLLKMSINKGPGMITIDEEIRNLKYYIDLCKMKNGVSFNFECVIQDEIMQVKVPRLLFQPIVENSLIHGFAEMRTGGIIILTGIIEGDKLTLCFEDNGKGIDHEKVDKILTDSYQETGDKYLFNSIGIKNVNERIKMNYGEEYGIKLENMKEGGTRVTMLIPYDKEMDYAQGNDCGR